MLTEWPVWSEPSEKKFLTHTEFIERFMLHLLPKGMRKIRYFGYMSNRDRQKSIDQVRQLIVENPDSLTKETGEIMKTETELNEEIDCRDLKKIPAVNAEKR